MREIVWDTETTGFDPQGGDRLVEIGAIELHKHIPTGRVFHQYINPERDMPDGAFQVHGLSIEFLRDYPTFAKVGQQFLDFVGDATLVAHNASFDMKFINAELGWAKLPLVPMSQSKDSLEIARKKFPGASNSLDALCRRFGVDNSNREKHGALLDSELLAEVYLELIGGRQPDFSLSVVSNVAMNADGSSWIAKPRPKPLASKRTAEEMALHDEFIATLGDSLWKKLS